MRVANSQTRDLHDLVSYSTLVPCYFLSLIDEHLLRRRARHRVNANGEKRWATSIAR